MTNANDFKRSKISVTADMEICSNFFKRGAATGEVRETQLFGIIVFLICSILLAKNINNSSLQFMALHSALNEVYQEIYSMESSFGISTM